MKININVKFSAHKISLQNFRLGLYTACTRVSNEPSVCAAPSVSEHKLNVQRFFVRNRKIIERKKSYFQEVISQYRISLFFHTKYNKIVLVGISVNHLNFLASTGMQPLVQHYQVQPG